MTLARKVETEIFRNARAPKSSVNVNVVDGVVWLRGEVRRPEQIRVVEPAGPGAGWGGAGSARGDSRSQHLMTPPDRSGVEGSGVSG